MRLMDVPAAVSFVWTDRTCEMQRTCEGHNLGRIALVTAGFCCSKTQPIIPVDWRKRPTFRNHCCRASSAKNARRTLTNNMVQGPQSYKSLSAAPAFNKDENRLAYKN